MRNNIDIYVAHYSKLYERKEQLINQFAQHKIKDYLFFEEYNKENLVEQDFKDDVLEIERRICRFIPRDQIEFLKKNGISDSQKSLALKHKYIYKNFLQKNRKDCFLVVLEDDVILVNNFMDILNKIIQNVKFDCINFGAGAAVKDKNKIIFDVSRLQFVHNKIHPFFSGSEGYIISYEACEKLYNLIHKNKLCLPIDWELSYFLTNFDIKCYNTNIPLTYQGSMIGKYKSSI